MLVVDQGRTRKKGESRLFALGLLGMQQFKEVALEMWEVIKSSDFSCDKIEITVRNPTESQSKWEKGKI